MGNRRPRPRLSLQVNPSDSSTRRPESGPPGRCSPLSWGILSSLGLLLVDVLAYRWRNFLLNIFG
jgi:hypothetical protein